jgi:hypothetical protein
MKIANRSSENVVELKCMGMTITNKNLIEEEIKRILNSECLLPFSPEPSVFSYAVKKCEN